ncbi:MAG: succinylglutamate desuccinylase/aspartoacylase family protein [Pseudazoarcus pumilus]|nr:succinylglutamate desuccinylase/aspartoacylase family protein [Pseudazoarcus pumilus]
MPDSLKQRFHHADLELAAHRFDGPADGPRLIVLGAVHGNEICGSIAIRQMLTALDSGELRIRRGSVTFVPVANPLAWKQRSREGERNLNRCLQPTEQPQQFEDHVANWLCPLLAQHDALLDLHSFHTPGEPFVMLGPEDNSGTLEPFARAAEERALAQHLGIRRFVDGWLDTYARGVERRRASDTAADPRYGVGTTEYMRSQGGYGVTVECGQHDDPQAIAVARTCILNTLAFLGFIDEPPPAAVRRIEHLRMFDVIDREHPDDRFARNWDSFDPVRAGTPVGTRADGRSVTAPRDGCILFPNPDAAPGREWFYLAAPV